MGRRQQQSRVSADQSMNLASATLAVLEWLLDIKIPAESAASLKAEIAADADDPEGKVGCEARVDLHREAMRRDTPARDALREKVQPAMVALLRADEAQYSTSWKAALALYDAANAPIAAGQPPLTHEIAQCYFNLLAFYQALVSNEEWKPLPEAARSDYKRKLVELYPGLPASAKQWVGNLPAFWTDLYAEWAGLAPDQRAAFRDKTIAELSGLKSWPMADVPMNARQIAASDGHEFFSRQRVYESRVAPIAGQGPAMNKLISIFRGY